MKTSPKKWALALCCIAIAVLGTAAVASNLPFTNAASTSKSFSVDTDKLPRLNKSQRLRKHKHSRPKTEQQKRSDDYGTLNN